MLCTLYCSIYPILVRYADDTSTIAPGYPSISEHAGIHVANCFKVVYYVVNNMNQGLYSCMHQYVLSLSILRLMALVLWMHQ